MSQENTLKPLIQNVVGLPVAILYRENRLSWRVDSKNDTSRNDSTTSPRFIGSTPEIPLVEWKKGIKLPADIPAPRLFDGYAVREQFMNLRTPQDCLNFLNSYGRLSSHQSIDTEVGWTTESLMKLQEIFRALAVRALGEWNDYANQLLSPQRKGANILAVLGAITNSRSSIEFRPNEIGHPNSKAAKYAGIIETNDVISTILTTLQVDHVRGARFGACARKDCQRFYEITSNHKRKYCSPSCAHLEGVRRTRKRQKAKKRKNGKGRAVK